MAEHTLTSATPVLPVARYRLHLRADTEVRLPGYAGSTWRGVLGHALKRTVCVTGARHCPDCLLYRSCVFPYLYDTPPPPTAQKLRKYPAAPHPLVIEPWPVRRAGPGMLFGLDLVLIGRGAAQLGYLLEALRRAGELGVGAGRGRYGLLRAEQETAGGWQPIYTAGGRLQALPATSPPMPPLPAGELRIELLTPLRLRVGGAPLAPHALRFRDFFTHLLRRISLLSYFHTDAPLETDFRGLADAAQRVGITTAELGWRALRRYSSRQDALLPLDGISGAFTVRGDLAPFWPYLWLGQWTHLGRAAVMGLGRYRLVAA